LPKNCVFTQNTAKLCKQKLDHNIGFKNNVNFFRRNSAKLAEIGDHNMDPGLSIFALSKTLKTSIQLTLLAFAVVEVVKINRFLW
jgi:hypothetical protein